VRTNLRMSRVAAFLVAALAAACGSSSSAASRDAGPLDEGGPVRDAPKSTDGRTGGGSASDGGALEEAGAEAIPTVTSSTPLAGAVGVSVNAYVAATFSESMDPTTLTALTFKLTSGTSASPVSGAVVYSNAKVVFWPTSLLPSDTSFTATISAGAKSAHGVALGAPYAWTFTTGSAVAAGVPVDLGTAGQYAVLAKTGISTVSPSTIAGNLGVSPAAATYLTGFSLVLDASGTFSTSSQVTGKVYAADYASPTPANLTTAIGDMETAFTAAAGRAPDVTGLGAGSIGGMTLPAGVYGWGTGLLIATSVTLTGSPTDVWVFQVAKNLTIADGAQVVLAGGALAQNVFWQVSGGATVGTTAQLEGTVLCQTAIALDTKASLTGRLLAQTAATLDANTIVGSP
jgi:hypothetical protein